MPIMTRTKYSFTPTKLLNKQILHNYCAERLLLAMPVKVQTVIFLSEERWLPAFAGTEVKRSSADQ